jgi:hypothetical protein
MGVRITGQGDEYVAIYDSVTMTAFGPVFTDAEQAEAFLAWLSKTDGRDARMIDESELHNLYSDFLGYAERKEAREKKRDEFLRGMPYDEVRDMLVNAFDDDEKNDEGCVLTEESFRALADDYEERHVTEAWELYQQFHGEEVTA